MIIYLKMATNLALSVYRLLVNSLMHLFIISSGTETKNCTHARNHDNRTTNGDGLNFVVLYLTHVVTLSLKKFVFFTGHDAVFLVSWGVLGKSKHFRDCFTISGNIMTFLEIISQF